MLDDITQIFNHIKIRKGILFTQIIEFQENDFGDLGVDNMRSRDEKQTFLRTQMILAIIPTFITQIIAFYRIKKLIHGLILEAVIFCIDLVIQVIISWPFGMIIALPITVGIPVYYVRKWTIEFNNMKTGLF